MIPVEVSVTRFKDTEAAATALNTLKQMEANEEITIMDAIIVSKDADGNVHSDDVEDVSASEGGVFGAVSGALIGMLGGPVGAVIGAITGAAVGAGAASMIDSGFSDDQIGRYISTLPVGESALIVLAEGPWMPAIESRLATFGGSTSRRVISDEEYNRLESIDFDDPSRENVVTSSADRVGDAVHTTAHTVVDAVKNTAHSAAAGVDQTLNDYDHSIRRWENELSQLRRDLAYAPADGRSAVESKLYEAESELDRLRGAYQRRLETDLETWRSDLEVVRTRAIERGDNLAAIAGDFQARLEEAQREIELLASTPADAWAERREALNRTIDRVAAARMQALNSLNR